MDHRAGRRRLQAQVDRLGFQSFRSLDPALSRTRRFETLGSSTMASVVKNFPTSKLKNYQNLVGPLIAPDRMAFRTSSIDARPRGAIPPHSNRVAAGVQ